MARIPAVTVTTPKGLTIVINHPEIEDAQELLDVSRIVVEASSNFLTDPAEFDYTLEQEKSIIHSYLVNPRELILVSRHNACIMGMLTFRVGLRRKVGHQGELGMAVHPDFIRQGVGQALLDVLLDWAYAHPEIEQLRLQVFKKNQGAIALYEANQFDIEGELKRGVKYLDGSYDNIVCMVRQIKP